jgi:hypothetical protein
MVIDSRENTNGLRDRRAGAVWRPPSGKRGACLLAALTERPGSVVRRVAGGDRARQMQFTRFLRNPAVTVDEMAATTAARTAEIVAGRDVLAIQDSSELVFGGRKVRERGFGPIGRGGGTGGLLLHAVIAIDATNAALLGLVDMQIKNRAGKKSGHRSERATAEKESHRWIDGMLSASKYLQTAKRITVVADRESDIYDEFACRPSNVHLITRVAQNRRIDSDTDETLFAFAEKLPEQARFEVTIPPAPGRAERKTVLAVRYAPTRVRKPKNGAPADRPDAVALTLVDIQETSKPKGTEAIHWRLLTTHSVETPMMARMILDFYRRRWIIEDYFRTLKTAGLDIEACEIEDPDAMTRFVGAAACAAVKVLQLVRARDGTDQTIADAFDPTDRALLEALSQKLEGKTARQKNPHPKGSLAFAAWVIARLGSWDGYYGKPGPKVMRIGLQNFQMIKYGHHLEPRDV